VRATRGPLLKTESPVAAPTGLTAPKNVPEIVGDFSDVKIVRHGLVIDASNGQKWVIVGFNINVYLNSSDSVHIKEIRLRTHKMSPPCRALLPLLEPQETELQANVGHSFAAYPQIEYWYDGTRHLPPSLEMIVVDEFEAAHEIYLRLGQTLPSLPENPSASAGAKSRGEKSP